MAAPHHQTSSSNNVVTPDTLITVKISVNSVPKRLKLPLRDLGINVLPDKLRQILDIKPDQYILLERYSDSAGGYISLNEQNPQVFKTLIRAAKAKLKLRLKATVTPVNEPEPEPEHEASDIPEEKEAAIEVESTAIPSVTPNASIRDSTALDQRSIGSGIFQFREARSSQQTLTNDEVPLPCALVPTNIVLPASHHELAFRSRAPVEPISNFSHAWSVYCNECDKSMDNAHYHCSICEGGDYDLCEGCVANGKLCPGEGHWLIKRFIKEGKVVQSTTERVSPSARLIPVENSAKETVPAACTAESEALPEPPVTRTCNNCVVVLPEREFVTCTTCDDFDLCLCCHTADRHGHHPAHGFAPATEQTVLTAAAKSKLAPARNVVHNAICDGCDMKIFGIRHKCLNCPDWDYCNECIKLADQTHRHHRFAALYEPIPEHFPTMIRHYGIYCDGPLCNKKPNQSYISGVRYKCAICNDTDFCAACEALPGNHHNRTHPLIKFKTPVRNVNVSTENEDMRGNVRMMGDRQPTPPAVSTRNILVESMAAQQANAATQVHTVADIKPTEVKKNDPIPVPVNIFKNDQTPLALPKFNNNMLNAHFVRDIVPDGACFESQTRFVQVWTMKNPGPYTWPAGCSVQFVGGDNMLNLDNDHPASVTDIAEASESNVVGRPVNAGEEVAFKVVLKAPSRQGKSISYWRLKAPDGTPFGHRLWCDIEVMQPPTDLPVTLIKQAEPRQTQAEPLLSLKSLGSRDVEKMNEEERRAAFVERVAQIKLDVLKTRAQTSNLRERLGNLSVSEKKIDEDEKVRKIIEEVSKEPEIEEETESENLEGSQMVFPKLEKESPSSSTYQSIHSSSAPGRAAYVENEEGEIVQSAGPASAPLLSLPVAPTAEVDVDDDLEVLSAEGNEDEDDSFMTDEEYDILDASDQETVA